MSEVTTETKGVETEDSVVSLLLQLSSHTVSIQTYLLLKHLVLQWMRLGLTLSTLTTKCRLLTLRAACSLESCPQPNALQPSLTPPTVLSQGLNGMRVQRASALA